MTVWPLDVGGVARDEREVRLVAVGGARGEADRDDHHAEVHDHAAVGPADEPAQALAAGRQHDLAAAPAPAANPPRPNATSGARPRAPSATASDHDADADPRRPQQPVRAAARRDALRHGSTGAIAMRNSSAMPIGIVMRSKYGRADRDAVAVAPPRRSAGTPCRAARRTRRRRTAGCWRGTRPRARPASRCGPASAGGRRASR